jgi:hypothetical protein
MLGFSLLSGMLAAVLGYYVQDALLSRDYVSRLSFYYQKLNHQHRLRLLAAYRTLLPLQRQQNLIDAFDRDNLSTMRQQVAQFLAQHDISPSQTLFFDLNGDPVGSIPSKTVASSVSRFIKTTTFESIQNRFFAADERVFQIYIVAVGQQTIPAGYVGLVLPWDFKTLAREAGLTFDSSYYDFSVLKTSQQANAGGKSSGIGHSLKATWPTLTEPPVRLENRRWTGLVTVGEPRIRIDLTLMNYKARLPIIFRTSSLLLDKNQYYLWIYGVVLLTTIATALGCGLMIRYLRHNLLQPMDRLFLFLKMLRARNRLQRRPSFEAFPLFRRLAREITGYTEDITRQNREIQAQLTTMQRQAQCAVDLAKLVEFERLAWMEVTESHLKNMFDRLHEIRGQNQDRITLDLWEIHLILRQLTGQSGFYAVTAVYLASAKLTKYLHRLGADGRYLDPAILDEIEHLTYEILEAYDLCLTVQEKWQGMTRDGINLAQAGPLSGDEVVFRLRERCQEMARFAVEHGRKGGVSWEWQANHGTVSPVLLKNIYPTLIECLNLSDRLWLELQPKAGHGGGDQQKRVWHGQVEISGEDLYLTLTLRGCRRLFREQLQQLVPDDHDDKRSNRSLAELWQVVLQARLVIHGQDPAVKRPELAALLAFISQAQAGGIEVTLAETSDGMMMTLFGQGRGVTRQPVMPQTG